MLLTSAIPLSCVAFSSVPTHRILEHNGITAKTTSLEATSSSRRELLQNTLTAATTASTLAFSNPTIANAAGAYTAEGGYDDFSNGLSMPKYNVDNEGQLGLSAPGNKTGDPAKAAKMEAKAAAAKEKAAAKAQAEAAKKAARINAEAAKREADAAKIAAKEEARKRQLANMSEEQRAKIEAYEAKKKENAGKPSVTDNMKRMYGL